MLHRDSSGRSFGIARRLIAILVLVLAAGRWWPDTVDDVYISVAYAGEWARTGALGWTTGERVEGYSNFLHVALLAAVTRLGGDAGLWAQGIALVSGCALVAWMGWRAPRGWAATVALLAFAAWSPLAYWSAVGLETTLFALLFAVGWTLVLLDPRSWGAGMTLLALGVLTRPEGTFWLLGGLVARVRFRKGLAGADALGALAILGVAAWHAWRVEWFGAFWPTPMLIKLGGAGLAGAAQALGDILVASGWAIGFAIVSRPKARDLPWILVPALGQCAVLVAADGDWMEMSRITLPGLVATGSAWLALGSPRTVGTTGLLVSSVAAVAATLLVPGGEGRAIPDPRSAPLLDPRRYARGLHTPLDRDVAWVIEEVPEGERILALDAGMLGNVPGMRFLDMQGLAWRACAEALAAGRHHAFLHELLHGDDPPEFVRFAYLRGGPPREEAVELGLPPRYRLRATVQYGHGSFTRWYALHDRRPSEETAQARWEDLARRFPSQPFFAKRLADRASTWILDEFAFPSSDGHPFVEGRGTALYWNSNVRSGDVSAEDAWSLRLDADAPGPEGAKARVTRRGACGETVEDHTIDGPTVVDLHPPCPGEPTFGVVVEFSNDGMSEAGDRNLYAALVRPNVR